jgi:internalin A
MNRKSWEQVLSIIDQAAREGSDRLDLSNIEITTIEDGGAFRGEAFPFDLVVDELVRVKGLRSLRLSNVKLKKLSSEIGRLTNLTSLDLSNNQLANLPIEIGQFTNLTVLNFSNNQITSLHPEIGELTNLQNLFLHGNKLATLPDEIGQLTNLLILTLGSESSENRLVDLPASIGNLTKLQQLDLDNNKLTTIPSEIGQLCGLYRLGISRNQLISLPPEIGKLVELRVLRLGYNNLTHLPDEIENLLLLQRLWLNGNKISGLPRGISKLTELITLDLTNNPIPIPPEVLSKVSNPRAILAYYLELEKFKRKKINQSKMLVLGEGSVGKTSIIQQILYGTFDPEQKKTEGILINPWAVKSTYKNTINETTPTSDDQSLVNINIWDFGGQEIMRATHQFFLTKRSLYLLVLDTRLTQEENRVEYWLKIIQRVGGGSPVLIIGNKVDEHPLDIDRTNLQKKYLNVVGILETSAAIGSGIEALKTAISEQVNNLPHVRDLLPENWFTIKTKLEELGRETNFITYDKYLELCLENEVADETSQQTLIGFLHDLGVVLYFQEERHLTELGILNPQWVTNGVYKILNAKSLFQNRAVLTISMLDEILSLPEYPRAKRLFIVDMMKKFELCYDVEPEKIFLVPDLLPKDEPIALAFTGVPAFEYIYSVLESNVITRFIVRMHEYIYENGVWRTGVLLKIGNNTALVKADIEDRKITIAIDGLEHSRRDTLSAIRFQLDEIHTSMEDLKPQKRVPVPNAPNAEPLDYEYLLMLEREGQEVLWVKDGTRLVKINVRQGLSAIESEADRKEKGTVINNYYSAIDGGVIVGGNLSGNLISGNDNKIIQDSYNKIKSADIDPELKETLKQLAEAVGTMIKSLPEEQASQAAENFEMLGAQAIKPKPNKQWYSVSIEGLIKAAENVEKVGEPVINLSRKVLSLLTLRIIP